MTGTPPVDPNDPNAVAAAIAAAGGDGGVGTPVGVPKGYKAPLHRDPPTATLGMPGLESLPGQVSPSEYQQSGLLTAGETAPYVTPPLLPGQIADPYQQGNQYYTGEEWAPQSLPPADVQNLQTALVQAGVLTATSMRPGVWDSSSATAYKVVLSYANATGESAITALQTMMANPRLQSGAAGSTKIPRAPFQLANPADIQAAVAGGGPGQSNTARDLIGQDLPAAEVKDFTNWYQQQEKTARAQYMAADMAGPGNSYTGAPNVGAAAQQYIKQHNLSQTVAYGTASRMMQFFDLLQGVHGV